MGAVACLYLLALEFPGLSQYQRSMLGDIATAASAIAGGSLAIWAAAARVGRLRAGWLLIGLGSLAYGMGDSVWAYSEIVLREEPRSPGLSDLFYLAMPPLMLAGVLCLTGVKGALGQARTAFDALSVVLGVTALVWYFALEPTFLASYATAAEKLITSAYPFGDLVLFVPVVLMLRNNRSRDMRRVLSLMAAGLILIIAADFSYVVLYLNDAYVSGGILDGGWLFGYLFVGAAATFDRHLQPSYQWAEAGVKELALREALSLIYIPVLFGFLVFVGTDSRHGMDLVAIALAWASVFAQIARQSVVLFDHANLSSDLELRVEERTNAIREAEHRFQSLTDTAPDAILTFSDAGVVESWNSAARRLYGYAADEVLGLPVTSLIPPTVEPHVLQPLAEAFAAVYGGAPYATTEGRGHRKDGSEFPMEISLAGWEVAGRRSYGAIIRDISDRKRYEDQLVYYANYDALTGLFNRHRLEQELHREIAAARRASPGGALLFLDLDGFKGVNDNLGHRSGDELLVSIASLLRSLFDESIILSRLGGDEFAIIAARVGRDEAVELAEGLMTALRDHTIVTHGQLVGITASIGIALFPEHGTVVEEVLVRADQAMYVAKEHRDRISVYSPESNLEALTFRRPWEQRIRHALETDGFVLEFQPIQGRDGTVQRYEALVRLLDDDGTLIPPSGFLEAAERSGQIHAIDRWVVTRSIRLIAERALSGQRLQLEVNLSGKAFDDPHLLPLIERKLRELGVDPGQLVFEVTETAAIKDIDEARRFVTHLKSLGCSFALDDFGVGFSSFYSLKQLPVDYLKIDGSLVRNLPNDTTDQHMVRAIAEMARALGKQTIAEYVADEETVALLHEYGVDYAQGFHIGPPAALPVPETPRMKAQKAA